MRVELATFAAGCFWGVEHLFRKKFGNGKGLISVRVGYVGRRMNKEEEVHDEQTTSNEIYDQNKPPTYTTVCLGLQGFAEGIQIEYDADIVAYKTLLEFFFRIHDPTTLDRQGPDCGVQYRSAIFTHNSDQDEIARRIMKQVQIHWWKQNDVVTQINRLRENDWWDAEDYHQNYLERKPGAYNCPSHYIRDFPSLKD